MSGPRRARTDSPSPPPAPPAPSPAPPGPLAEEAIGFAFGRSPAPGSPPKVVPSSSNARLPTHRTSPPETSRSNRSPECTASPPTRQPIHPSAHAPRRNNTPAPQLTAPHSTASKKPQHTYRYFYGILSWHARFNKTPASRQTRFAILANGPQSCPTKPALLFPARGRVSDDPRAFLSASLDRPARPTASPTRPRRVPAPSNPTQNPANTPRRTLTSLTPRNARLSRRSTGSFRPAPLAPQRAKPRPQSNPSAGPSASPIHTAIPRSRTRPIAPRCSDRSLTPPSRPQRLLPGSERPGPPTLNRPPTTAETERPPRAPVSNHPVSKPRASIRQGVPPPPIGDSSARQTRAARHARSPRTQPSTAQAKRTTPAEGRGRRRSSHHGQKPGL